jgi:hypothetical protein
MRANHLEHAVIGQFFAALKDRRTDLPHSHNSRPMLYLKCWGSDYPYLHGFEPQTRWLPVPVDSPLSKPGHASKVQGKEVFAL